MLRGHERHQHTGGEDQRHAERYPKIPTVRRAIELIVE